MSDVAAAAAAQPASPSTPPGLTLWSQGGGFSFKDLLDIVNPLQHIPVVGSIYRYLTGDEPSGADRIIGDSLYGGPIGFGTSVVATALFTDSSGKDLGERLLASVFGPRDASPTLGQPAVARATSAPVGAQAATPLAAMPNQPVAMNQLFQSAPPASPASPQQTFLSQTAQFQRKLANGRGTNGAVLNDHPVPLQLSSNLLPVVPPGSHLVGPASAASSTGQAAVVPDQAPATASANPPPVASPIAQKMLDALDKYEQLKKQEEQQDSAGSGNPSSVDLTL